MKHQKTWSDYQEETLSFWATIKGLAVFFIVLLSVMALLRFGEAVL